MYVQQGTIEDVLTRNLQVVGVDIWPFMTPEHNLPNLELQVRTSICFSALAQGPMADQLHVPCVTRLERADRYA